MRHKYLWSLVCQLSSRTPKNIVRYMLHGAYSFEWVPPVYFSILTFHLSSLSLLYPFPTGGRKRGSGAEAEEVSGDRSGSGQEATAVFDVPLSRGEEERRRRGGRRRRSSPRCGLPPFPLHTGAASPSPV